MHPDNRQILFLGLQYNLEKGWKTYWLSSGEGGFPQELNWNKSTNIKNIKVDWPTPKEFEILGIKSLGYYDKVIFPLTIELNDPSKNSLMMSFDFSTGVEIISMSCFSESSFGSGYLSLSIL